MNKDMRIICHDKVLVISMMIILMLGTMTNDDSDDDDEIDVTDVR